ncbi:ATP-dependent acyl-CoA ligase [Variovorax sp. GB1P17]|uniref:ATP-dependent acyl-CoA ligase n=1 Tax=Variovorax sp. GB1P17 TaxID=3443740 RepID=UPI003F445B1E
MSPTHGNTVPTQDVPGAPPMRERTLPRMLKQQQECRPHEPVLTIGDTCWTHDDAATAASKRGARLREAGVVQADRVASMCSNRVEALELFLGCGWIGAVSVPINVASKAPQIQYYLEDSRAALLVIEAGFLPELAQVDLARTALRTVWVVGGSTESAAFGIGAVAVKPYPPGAAEVPAEEVMPSETLAILYTSGTTGAPKGVVCPHGHYFLFGMYSAQMLGVVAGDVLFTTLPLFHINALNTFAQASIVGCHAVIHPRFSASGFWTSAQDCGATVVYLLGAMVPMLLAQPPAPAERAHRVRVGLGGGVPGPSADQFHQRTGITLVDGYASTETSIVISAPPGTRGLGAMGWLRPGFQARVADDLDVEVPRGEAGELLLRADEPFAFSNGYFGQPDKTLEAWRSLWFHTGDRVVQEADGSFRFIDRMKDAIRRRGENISSYEVEQAFLRHPDVAQVAAYPVRSELAEDEVMVTVVARPDRTLDLPELAQHCERLLPYFAVPRYFDVVLELPRTQNGKVQKFRLRETGVTPSTWERPNAARRPPVVK